MEFLILINLTTITFTLHAVVANFSEAHWPERGQLQEIYVKLQKLQQQSTMKMRFVSKAARMMLNDILEMSA
jgi:hypothetical protein